MIARLMGTKLDVFEESLHVRTCHSRKSRPRNTNEPSHHEAINSNSYV